MTKALFINGPVDSTELEKQYVKLLPGTGDFLICDTGNPDYLTVVVKRSLHVEAPYLTKGVEDSEQYLTLLLPRDQIKGKSDEVVLDEVAAKFKWLVTWDFDLTLAAEHTSKRSDEYQKEGKEVPIRNEDNTVKILKRLHKNPQVQLGVVSKGDQQTIKRYFTKWNDKFKNTDNEDVFDQNKFLIDFLRGVFPDEIKPLTFMKYVELISTKHKGDPNQVINLNDPKQFFVIGGAHVDDSDKEIQNLKNAKLGIELFEASINKDLYKDEVKQAEDQNIDIELLINANDRPNEEYLKQLEQFADRIDPNNKQVEITTAAKLIEANLGVEEQPLLTEETSSEVPQFVSDSVLLDLILKRISITSIDYTEELQLPLRDAIKILYSKELEKEKFRFFRDTQSVKREAHIENQVELALKAIMTLTRRKLSQGDQQDELTNDDLLALPPIYHSVAQNYYRETKTKFEFCKATEILPDDLPEDNAEESETRSKLHKPESASWVDTKKEKLIGTLEREIKQSNFMSNGSNKPATLNKISRAETLDAKQAIFKESAKQYSLFRAKETQIFYEVWSDPKAATLYMNALDEVMKVFHQKNCDEDWKLGTWGGKTCTYKWEDLSYTHCMPHHAADFATLYAEIRGYKKHVGFGYQEALRNLSDCINSTYNSNEKRDPKTQDTYNQAWAILIGAYYQRNFLDLNKVNYKDRVDDMDGTFLRLTKLLNEKSSDKESRKITSKQALSKIAAAKLHLEVFETDPKNQTLSEYQKYLHRAEVLSVLSYELFTLAQNEIPWGRRSGSKTYNALMKAVNHCNDITNSENPDSKISKAVEKYMSEHAQFLRPASEQFNRFYSLETKPSIPRFK